MTEFLMNNWQEVCAGLLFLMTMFIGIYTFMMARELKHDDFYARPLTKKEQRELKKKFPKIPKNK